MRHFTNPAHVIRVLEMYSEPLLLNKESAITHLAFKLDFVVPLPLIFYELNICVLGMSRLQRKVGYQEE